MKKYIIYILVVVIVITMCMYIYKRTYINSYEEIKLEKIAVYEDESLDLHSPCWVAVTTEEVINNIETKYMLDLSGIDLKNHMLIMSYGSELTSLDYNLKESTYLNRGHYIGYSNFEKTKSNRIFFYKASFVPIFDVEAAGFPPDYKGRYR